MIIEQHIEELRAELKANLDAEEIATIERELQAAFEQKMAAEIAFQSMIEA